jgi:hypothetical protein
VSRTRRLRIARLERDAEQRRTYSEAEALPLLGRVLSGVSDELIPMGALRAWRRIAEDEPEVEDELEPGGSMLLPEHLEQEEDDE